MSEDKNNSSRRGLTQTRPHLSLADLIKKGSVMSIFALVGCLVVGWFGWSLWFSIPLGFLLYYVTYREQPERATRVAHAAWLVAPLIALGIIWIGRGAHAIIA